MSTHIPQITTITTGSNVRTFGYLASGQVSGDQRTATSDYTFAFNNNGRLATASLNGSGVGSYLYNAFEQRVQKTAGGAVVDLIYDRAGHLLVEANDATGAAIREYIWMDDLPVAMVDDTGSSPVVYYIHTDQLGTPQKLTDAYGGIVWDGVFDPFGNAVPAVTTNWNATSAIWGSFTWSTDPNFVLPLRFPGQYADTETALNQNWNRDYDPTIGGYVESDPMGLWSGTNTYAYADSNPLNDSDRTGEQRTTPVPFPTPFPVPPIAIPGTPENQQWTRWATHELNQLRAYCFGEVDCKKVHENCHRVCADEYVGKGYGSDAPQLYRKCVRQCMAENGCRDY